MKIFLGFCLLLLITLPAPARRQDEERNKSLTIRFYEEVWSRGNVDAVDEVFAPDYTAHDGSAAPPRGVEPAEAQKKIACVIRSMFSEYSFVPEFLIAEGDKVVTRWTIRGKPKGLLSVIAAREVKISGVNIFRFENGKIVEIWNHRDDLGAQKQLGISKVPYGIGFVAGSGVWLVTWLALKVKRKYLSRNSIVSRAGRSGAAIGHQRDMA